MKIVKGLYYSKDHEWIKVEDGIATIGVTDFAQHSLGEVVYVELPEEDDEFKVGEIFGVLESVKAASDSYAPISGVVYEINEELEDTPNLINDVPYDAWIFKMKINDESELKILMNADEYEKFCGEEA